MTPAFFGLQESIANSENIEHKSCLLCALIFASSLAFGEIKNGYENEILPMKVSLKKMIEILNEENNLSIAQRKMIRSKIHFIEKNILYYELTRNLLNQFKIVAPHLYAEIDSIKDKRGRIVNVYIKFIPQDETAVKAWGTTYLDQQETDSDGYLSSYGANTASIKIWIVRNALLVLAHELGHVKYQVPNLASYVEYYRRQYPNAKILDYIGHDCNDPSGMSAIKFEKIFKKKYINFLRSSSEKFQNPLVLRQRIKKNIDNHI